MGKDTGKAEDDDCSGMAKFFDYAHELSMNNAVVM